MTLRDLAQEYGFDAQELFDILAFENFPISGIDDPLDDRVAEYLLEYVDNKKAPKRQKNTRRLTPDKKGSRSKNGDAGNKNRKSDQYNDVPHICVARPMTVAHFATSSGVQSSQVITYWLKKGCMYPLQYEMSLEQVREAANHFNIPLIEEALHVAESAHASTVNVIRKNDLVLKKQQSVSLRIPVVVVVGHVDHGKTTLLDYIRKTTVAAGEKGGITQHIGAYKARVDGYGEIVFIDTPGHEAFSIMREHGLSVADIAILVVAADDGIMPQTVEAIKMAQSVGLTIVVAINKVDKVSQKEIDKTYQGLAEYGLTPEVWGGSTTCLLISALKGTGIKELLEFVFLASQVLDLSTDLDAPAAGYILEAHQEKGKGIVATVILQHGKISVGQHFSAGGVNGKIVSLVDSLGKNISLVGPSEPVLVSGFNDLPEVGVAFTVGSASAVKQSSADYFLKKTHQKKERNLGLLKENTLSFIIKADTISSLHALSSVIKKMENKFFYQPIIISESIGSVTESDVEMASITDSTIYVLNSEIISSALLLAKTKNVEIISSGIIYDLTEKIKGLLEKPKTPRTVEKKLGEVEVLKVFSIKGFGVVAGGRVLAGSIKLGSKVNVIRNKQKVFSGGIVRSLQKERQDIKEAAKGHECAFLVDKFSQWEEGDIAEIYQITQGA